jgi:hypothetical protein
MEAVMVHTATFLPPTSYPHLVLYSSLRTFHFGSFNFSECIRKQGIFLNYKKLLLSGRLLFKNCQNRCTLIFLLHFHSMYMFDIGQFFSLCSKRDADLVILAECRPSDLTVSEDTGIEHRDCCNFGIGSQTL